MTLVRELSMLYEHYTLYPSTALEDSKKLHSYCHMHVTACDNCPMADGCGCLKISIVESLTKQGITNSSKVFSTIGNYPEITI